MRSKYIGVFVLGISFWCMWPAAASAGVYITEIMFDVEGTDTGREWIEVYNDGNETVDLSAWKLFEGNVAHKLTPVGSQHIPPQGYAIISDVPAKFLEDYSGFSGLVFDSVFSLGNDGETVVLRNESGADTDSVTYSGEIGARGDGMSLQKTSQGSWIAAAPTPGLGTSQTQSDTPLPSPNEDTGNDITSTTKNPDPSSTHANQAIANVSFDAPELIVTSGRPRIGFVGVPLSFEAKISHMNHIPVGNAAAHVWTWGDGSITSGQFVSHTYEYPGEYIVVLNSSIGGASAVSKVKVKIVSPQVSLEYVDAASIVIENADGNELNIGGWSLETGGDRKVFPQDTIIAPHSSIRILLRTLGIRSVSGFIRLLNPSHTVMSENPLIETTILLPSGMTEAQFREKLIQELRK